MDSTIKARGNILMLFRVSETPSASKKLGENLEVFVWHPWHKVDLPAGLNISRDTNAVGVECGTSVWFCSRYHIPPAQDG